MSEENNPIIAFIQDLERGELDIVNEATHDVYARYKIFCNESNMQPMSHGIFSKEIKRMLKLDVVFKKINGMTPGEYRRRARLLLTFRKD